MFVQILPNDLQHVMDSAFPCFRIISCLCCVEVLPFLPFCIVGFYLLLLRNRYVGKLGLVNCTAVYNVQDLTPTCCTMSFVCSLMLRHVSALAVGHLRGARWFCNMWSVTSI